MSLFKAREWWSTVSGYEEFHDLGCLALGNLDNSPTTLDKIVVGSFQGLVRIYEPRPPQFTPGHVILEQQFSSPVLQVAIGRFVQGSPHYHLAVLHPRELVVCTLTSDETSDGSVVNLLTPVYSHLLQRTACNMICGPFGGSKGCESVCVQSMDGQLSFFSQESHTFDCFLPDFLLPGPLAYLPKTDALVTVNSAHYLQVFRYQALSVGGSAVGGSAVGGGTTRNSGKKFTADWSANIGEGVVDVCVVSPPTGRAQILVLGERSVFSFKDNGILRFMKKLEFNPSCFHGYSTTPPPEGEDSGMVQYLLGTHTGQLLVLRDTTLVWAASLEYTPVQLATGAFRELEGVIVSLDELGHLTCSYLGTDPTLFAAAPHSSQRTINYQELENEMSQLNKQIRTSQKGGLLSEGGVASALLITSLVDAHSVRTVQLDEEEGGLIQDMTTPIKKCVEVKVTLSSLSGPALRNVTMCVNSQLPLTTHPSHFTLPEVSSTQDHAPLVLTVVATPTLLPTSTHLTLSATYTSNEGLPQAIRHEVELPVDLFCEPGLPDKTATHKITVDVNHYVKELTQLFPRPLIHPSAPNNAMALSFLNSTKLTIVASPSSSRYRLQSDSLAALGVGLKILLGMLSRHFAGSLPVFQATFTPPLPLNEYFEIIERHYRLRANIEHCKEWLSRHAQQFRSIQKRLLTRFKDKTPVGLAHLDTLLDGTYMQLMSLAEKNELFLLELQECSNQLSCATLLINTLLRLATSMSDSDYNVLTAALSPRVTTETDQGWEESTDAAVTHLLRTTLSKSQKEATLSVAAVEMPSESSKLKKHIALLCERVLKGGRPATGKIEATQSLSTEEDSPLTTSTPSTPLTTSTPSTGAVSSGSKVSRRKPHSSRLPSLPEVGESPETL